MGYVFKTYFLNGREHFVFGEDQIIKTDFPFSESLMKLLDLEYSVLGELCQRLDKAIRDLCMEKDPAFAAVVRDGLEELAEKHIYFEFLRLDWTDRLNRAEEMSFVKCSGLLPHKDISRIPSEIAHEQKQIREIIRLALDIDANRDDPRPPEEKLFSYYQNENRDLANNRLSLFQFRTLPLSYEMTESDVFCEVLHPESICDLIDYAFRKSFMERQRWRVCRHCGKYFPIRSRASAEYCDRVITAAGGTCKEVGSTKVWEEKMSSDELFRIYRREYKRRFAWIRLGKWTQEEFSSWSAEAQEKRTLCGLGKVSPEEFIAWIKS